MVYVVGMFTSSQFLLTVIAASALSLVLGTNITGLKSSSQIAEAATTRDLSCLSLHSCFIWMILSPLFVFFTTMLPILWGLTLCLLHGLDFWTLTIFLLMLSYACLAMRLQSIFHDTISMKVLLRSRQYLVTLRTTLIAFWTGFRQRRLATCIVATGLAHILDAISSALRPIEVLRSSGKPLLTPLALLLRVLRNWFFRFGVAYLAVGVESIGIASLYVKVLSRSRFPLFTSEALLLSSVFTAFAASLPSIIGSSIRSEVVSRCGKPVLTGLALLLLFGRLFRLYAAIFAIGVQSIEGASVPMKELRSSRLPLFTLGALLLTGMLTPYTDRFQAICISFIKSKVGRGSGKFLQTIAALFAGRINRGYNIRHSCRPSSQGGSSGVVRVSSTCSSAHQYLLFYSTIKRLPKQVHAHFPHELEVCYA